jgi:hypothetical protein
MGRNTTPTASKARRTASIVIALGSHERFIVLDVIGPLHPKYAGRN